MAISVANNYIEFGFDPYKFIEEGIEIVRRESLRTIYSLSRVTGGGSVSGKPYNWHGYNPSSTLTAEQQFDINSGLGSFLDQNLLNKFEDIYSNIQAKLDLGGDIKAARIKFTDKPLGVFSFAQASKGLIRPVEYFSLKENKLIKPDDVLKGNLGETEYYYYLLEKEEVLVQRRQQGTTKILENCEDAILKQDPITRLYLPYTKDGKVKNSCGEDRLRYTSTVKKVFAYRQKKGGGIAPYVDLYISTGGTADKNPESMIIRSMPNLLLARILEKSGVKVRIFAFWSNRDGGRDRDFNTIFMVKNYGETVDLNKLSVFTADTRFYRYWLANATVGTYFKMCGDGRSGFDTTGTNSNSTFNREILPLVRNYVDYQIKVGSFPSQVVNKKLMIFCPLDAYDGEKIEDAAVEEKIIDAFYKAIDYIQLQLTKTPRVVFQEIIKREKAKLISDSQIRIYLKDIVTQTILPTKEIQTISPLKLKESFDLKKITKADYERQLKVQIQLDSQEQIDERVIESNKLLEIIKNLIP
jgi:hypothetical protein